MPTDVLSGAIEGKNVIRVDVKEVGEEKRLDFIGETVDAPEAAELEPVAAGKG